MIISWNTTNKCNMHCEHCYRDSGKMAEGELSTTEGKKLIDDISKAGFKIMIFSGGEPLLREDIYELIGYASKIGLRCVIGSNGTLITLEAAQKLKKAGVMRAGISLDSLKAKKHDSFRNYSGAWENTIIGIENLKKAGISFQINTTVMKWNKDEVKDITDFGVNLGASAHHVFFLVPTGRGANLEEQILSKDDYENLIKDIMLKQTQGNIEIKPTCAPQFVRIAEQNNIETRFKKGCLAGIKYCIISPTGNVQPCAYLNFSAGNVKQKSFGEIWRKSPILKKLRTMEYGGKCGTCKYKNKCGGCRARAAFYSNGDIMASDTWCIYNEYEENKING
ncbi:MULTISPECIES: putative heme d1 biosynthesis radical SAM protein NirJ2 [Clostridium]|uniref:putative heme d1 biosynthesis radical SAM protein NirJ2 n=1 Tax=Clostridium TaxID=1485 RepID=UPI000825592E|nr:MULTISPECIES: putative heme d1 biosynthesis radical SAM protein NirJ2 [Clostridium]PJI07642.1 putative heme d1 biosynthesis radical SAM protein NirJ2 [Clostridium sp. CT7]